jgi:hypothetical protein
MRIGFTGTRQGMTQAQQDVLEARLLGENGDSTTAIALVPMRNLTPRPASRKFAIRSRSSLDARISRVAECRSARQQAPYVGEGHDSLWGVLHLSRTCRISPSPRAQRHGS